MLNVNKHLDNVRNTSEDAGFVFKVAVTKGAKTFYKIGLLIVGGIAMTLFGFVMGIVRIGDSTTNKQMKTETPV